MQKKNKNALLLCTLHNAAEVNTQEDRKTAIILNYNTNNGGVDNLEKATGIQPQEQNCLWSLTIFKTLMGISTSNNL